METLDLLFLEKELLFRGSLYIFTKHTKVH